MGSIPGLHREPFFISLHGRGLDYRQIYRLLRESFLLPYPLEDRVEFI